MAANKINTNLNIVKDSYTSDGVVLFTSYAMNKCSLVFENLNIKFSERADVINKLMALDGELVRNDFEIAASYTYIVLESDDFLITIDLFINIKKCKINLYHNSYSKAKPLFDLISSYKDKQDNVFVSILSYFQNSAMSLISREDIKDMDDFSIDSEEYYPYLNVNELFRQYSMSDGNILLLCGIPGTGKTRLGDLYMKYLLDNYESEDNSIGLEEEEDTSIGVCYVKNEEILARDDFWNELKDNEISMVFLDDLDYGLLPRTQQVNSEIDSNKNKFISHLLSFTDGIFEEGSKTKFIITTNRNVSEIDKAVLRKGRTFDIIQLRELTLDEARGIWLKSDLSESDFNLRFNKPKVLQADLGSAIKSMIASMQKDKPLKPYILEEGISLYNRTLNSKKIGV